MKRASVLLAILCLVASPAAGQSGINFGPESGPHVARGSAWVARADSPLATFYNPAGLSRQVRSLVFGGHFMSLDRCFARLNAAGGLVSPGGGKPAAGAAGGPPAETCMSRSPYFNAQLAATFRLTDRWQLGLAVLGPHAVGKFRWPETVDGSMGPQPAANRFQLVDDDALLAFPTVSLGYVVNDQLSVGGGFVAGVFSETATLYGEGLSPAPNAGVPPADDFLDHQEMKLFLEAEDRFIPGVVLGLLWSPRPTVDVGLWYRQSARVRAAIQLRVESRAWTPAGTPNTQPCGPSEPSDCNVTDPPGVDGYAIEKLPPELRGGVRYHRPRDPARPAVGDGLVDDVFDVELDVAWARNSLIEQATLDLSPTADTPIRGVDGDSRLPDEAGVTKNWKDSVSIRFGGEYVVRPSRVAIQGGTFYESAGQDARDLHVHFDLASRWGVSGGALFRLTDRADLQLAYQRIVWADLDNGGAGGSGGLSGDPRADNETRQVVNGGLLTSAMDEVGVWLRFRF
jgi:hypothetical protein